MTGIRNRVGRWSDRALALVAPQRTADAVCGGWIRCRVVMGARAVAGTRRVDPEHGGFCTPCYTNGTDC
jgi:hypothetical protein